VDVSSDIAGQALAAGRLVLTDREQTPIAELTDITLADGRLTGSVEPRRAREARLFLSHAAPPDRVPAPPHARHVVVTSRPLLAADVDRLQATVDEVLVLVPVEGPTPDGLPPVTLMRSVLAASESLKVVAVPMLWRDPESDAALATNLGAAYGATSTELLTDGPDWTELLAALQAGDDLPPVASAGVLAELSRWRPPPSRRGAMLLFTGFSGSGKSTLARDLAEYIVENSPRTVSLLDGDDVRRLLSSGLGFDRAARDLNVRRIGFVGSEIARHGGLAICAPIAPYAESRAAVRAMVEPVGDFILVHVSTPLEECERRDLKGLYAKARAGLIPEFTGISDPYDVPTDADLSVDTSQVSREEALESVVKLLFAGGWLAPQDITLTPAESE
jgi:adenylyl-sulfate kinase